MWTLSSSQGSYADILTWIWFVQICSVLNKWQPTVLKPQVCGVTIFGREGGGAWLSAHPLSPLTHLTVATSCQSHRQFPWWITCLWNKQTWKWMWNVLDLNRADQTGISLWFQNVSHQLNLRPTGQSQDRTWTPRWRNAEEEVKIIFRTMRLL